MLFTNLPIKAEENTQIPLTEVIETVTKNPAKKLNVYDKLGSVEVGKSADFVIFDENLNIKKTIINGEVAYPLT